MSKNFGVEFTSKMPFAGKHLVKYMFQSGRKASRKGNIGGKLASSFGLGAFALMHASQLKSGINSFEHNENNPALAGFDALYSTANAMAVYTQAYLGLKVLRTRRQALVGQPVSPDGITLVVPAQPILHHETPKIGHVTPLELAVTLGGQALFFATTL